MLDQLAGAVDRVGAGHDDPDHEDGDVHGDEDLGEDRLVPGERGRPRYSFWAPFFTHSGQWNPTEAWCMHAGQMGRSQRWQTTPAGWPGWR